MQALTFLHWKTLIRIPMEWILQKENVWVLWEERAIPSLIVSDRQDSEIGKTFTNHLACVVCNLASRGKTKPYILHGQALIKSLTFSNPLGKSFPSFMPWRLAMNSWQVIFFPMFWKGPKDTFHKQPSLLHDAFQEQFNLSKPGQSGFHFLALFQAQAFIELHELPMQACLCGHSYDRQKKGAFTAQTPLKKKKNSGYQMPEMMERRRMRMVVMAPSICTVLFFIHWSLDLSKEL